MKQQNRTYKRFREINILLFSIFLFFTVSEAEEKKPVIISGDNAKTKLIINESGEKIYLTELTGHPLIKTDNKEIRTDKIIIRGNNGEIVEAHGNVLLMDKTKGTGISAAKAILHKEKQIIEFFGNPSAVLIREDDKSAVNIQSETMKYDIENNVAEAEGKVKLKNNDLYVFSGKAVFRRDEKTAIFTGNPEIRKGDDIFNAEEITYYTDKKIIILNKNAHVKTYSEEKDKKNNRVIKILTKASGDRIEHYSGGEPRTIVIGNALIEREDSVSTGNRFEITGEKGKEYLTGLNVHINYNNENTEAFGDHLKSNRNDGYSVLWGKTSIIIKNENGEETSRIYGDHVEHYRDTDELYISGNVNIVQDEGIIKGDIARYERRNNFLTVTGNARIENDKSIVLTHAITINTKNKETKLLGDIRGRGVN